MSTLSLDDLEQVYDRLAEAIDAAQPGEEQRHHEARALPHAGDHDGRAEEREVRAEGQLLATGQMAQAGQVGQLQQRRCLGGTEAMPAGQPNGQIRRSRNQSRLHGGSQRVHGAVGRSGLTPGFKAGVSPRASRRRAGPCACT